MDDRLLSEKAAAFTALTLFYGGDEKKAWSVLSALDADYSVPFASYTREFTQSSEEEGAFNALWRDVRSSFDSSRIPFSVMEYSSPLSDVHFLYLAGRRELLEGRKLCFLGAVMPSLQGRQDTALCALEAVKNGYIVTAPFDSGLGPYALSVALKESGDVCAVLSSSLTKCPNENLLSLMEAVYEKGLLVSQFSPYTKREKWHVVLRNRFLSSFADAFYMAEEKDGGPGWAVFDAALKNGRKCALSSSASGNPNFTWCRMRSESGSSVIKKPSEIKSLFPAEPRRRKASRQDPLQGDLFSGLEAWNESV